MYDPQSINLHEILTYWGFSDAELIKHFHLDSPRIMAEIRNGNRHYILKGIPDTRDGESRGVNKRYAEMCLRINSWAIRKELRHESFLPNTVLKNII